MPKDENPDKKIIIHINSKKYEAPKPAMTGREIKELGGGPIDYWLILNVKGPNPQAGGDDRQIKDDEVIQLENGMHFRIVNPATFGDI